MNLGYLTHHQLGKFEPDYILTSSPGFVITWFHIPIPVELFVPGNTNIWTCADTVGYLYIASEKIDIIIVPTDKFDALYEITDLDISYDISKNDYVFLIKGNQEFEYSIENQDFEIHDVRGYLFKLDRATFTYILVNSDITFADIRDLEFLNPDKVDLEVG